MPLHCTHLIHNLVRKIEYWFVWFDYSLDGYTYIFTSINTFLSVERIAIETVISTVLVSLPFSSIFFSLCIEIVYKTVLVFLCTSLIVR